MDNLEEFRIPDDALEKLRDPEVLRRFVNEGKTFQEILGYDTAVMEKFYGAAYNLFQEGKYRPAADAFTFLSTLNPYVHNYWLGLGMSEQMNEEYEAGLVAYGMAVMCDVDNPVAHYHSATCHYLLGDSDTAVAMLDLVIERCGELTQHVELKKQAIEAKQRLKARE